LPGPSGKRFDYLTIDPDDHYLISARLATGQTYVIDLRTNRVVGIIVDTPGAEGVEYVSEGKDLYTSNARNNTVGVVDLSRLKVIKNLPTERKPDGSAYATPFHKLYVSNERGKAEAIVDVTKDEIVRTLHFSSETGMPQYDPVARKAIREFARPEYFCCHRPRNGRSHRPLSGWPLQRQPRHDT
jgi:YVTN family beta-propeller protein